MELSKCICGKEVAPGEDMCYECLGQEVPKPLEIGSEEWKEEMRYFWEKISKIKGEW